jgi:hypothetical protein
MKMIAAAATSMGGTARQEELWEPMPYFPALTSNDPNAQVFTQGSAPLKRPTASGSKRAGGQLQQENTRAPVYHISINVTGDVTAPFNLFNGADGKPLL